MLVMCGSVRQTSRSILPLPSSDGYLVDEIWDWMLKLRAYFCDVCTVFSQGSCVCSSGVCNCILISLMSYTRGGYWSVKHGSLYMSDLHILHLCIFIPVCWWTNDADNAALVLPSVCREYNPIPCWGNITKVSMPILPDAHTYSLM